MVEEEDLEIVFCGMSFILSLLLVQSFNNLNILFFFFDECYYFCLIKFLEEEIKEDLEFLVEDEEIVYGFSFENFVIDFYSDEN